MKNKLFVLTVIAAGPLADAEFCSDTRYPYSESGASVDEQSAFATLSECGKLKPGQPLDKHSAWLVASVRARVLLHEQAGAVRALANELHQRTTMSGVGATRILRLNWKGSKP